MRCTECKEECSGKETDNGIGSYEFWGAKGTHHDVVLVSECCEAEVISEAEHQGELESKFEDELSDLYVKYEELGLNLKDMTYQAKNFYEGIKEELDKEG